MVKDLKLLLMVNWREEGQWGFYKYLKQEVRELKIIQPFFFTSTKNLLLNKISLILSEFYLPIIAYVKRRNFDFVMSWSMRFGICYGVFNALAMNPADPQHIIYDFHINLIRKDPIYRLRIRLLKLAVKGIDFFLCTSQKEEKIYSEMFNIQPNRIQFFPMTSAAHLFTDYPFLKKDYIFAYGNSDRDYESLIRAVEGLDIPTIILSQAFFPARPLPANVTLITEKRVGLDLIELIVSSRMVVLPLQNYMISAGQTAMLETMALGQPLVITSNMATQEYAKDGDSALFFDAGDSDKLKEHMEFLLNNPDKAEELGRNARDAIQHNTEQKLSIVLGILDDLQRKAISNVV